MKKNLILFALLIAFGTISAQKVITTKSEIEDVTVYLYGAEVKAKSVVNLTKGRGIFEITNVSPQAINNSVQIFKILRTSKSCRCL